MEKKKVVSCVGGPGGNEVASQFFLAAGVIFISWVFKGRGATLPPPTPFPHTPKNPAFENAVFSIPAAFLGYKLRVYKKKRGATSSPRPPPALLPCPNICLWFFGFGLRAVFSVESS